MNRKHFAILTLAVGLLTVGLCERAEATASVAHSCKNDNAGTSAACTLTSVTSGNILVVFCLVDGTSANISVSDDKTNTYTERVESDTIPGILAATATAGSSGNTVVTCAFGDSFTGILAAEIAGAASFDAVSSANSGTSSTPSASVSLSGAGIVVAAFALRAGGTNSAGSGYTLAQSIDAYSNINGALEYKVGSAGSYTADFTGGGSAAWRAAAVAILESGGSPPPSGSRLPCSRGHRRAGRACR